ncbi:MAG: hypothetical protein HZB61_06910 [Nitrospirae bacterium]|nr:hypothetical protein [Nitrospirota bacterium]
MPDNLQKYSLLITFLLIGLIGFNLYYFFIRRNVGPSHYIDKFSHGPVDAITEDPLYQDSVEEYSYLNKKMFDKKVIVFLGDSITKRFNFSEYFPGWFILNRGILSDTTQGVIMRIDKNVNNLNIEKLFLMIGYNDLAYRTDEEILNNINTILYKVKAQKIYVQSLLPVEGQRRALNKRLININNTLQKLCDVRNCTYIDLHSKFIDVSGGMDARYSQDGVHPDAVGYELWSRLILPILTAR